MSELTEKGKIIKGFKATDKNMKCKGFKYELGKWYDYEGELALCESGFHFCPHMSGVWAYYPIDSRVFKVEAELVLMDYQPGADLKYVAKRIRLVEEVKIGGDWNTGNWNTGDWNTGDWNTGDRNTGDRNTGDWNTGNWNTGDWNTGNWNTGDRNTGIRNTGDGNTGNWNTGDGNTGDGNTSDYGSGFFCQNKQYAKCFDVQTKLTHQKFRRKYDNLLWRLSDDLAQDKPFDYDNYKSLPGYTLRKIKSLHKKHIEGRKR